MEIPEIHVSYNHDNPVMHGFEQEKTDSFKFPLYDSDMGLE